MSHDLTPKKTLLEMLLEHYTGNVSPQDFPNWSQDQVWINCIRCCPVQMNKQCNVCVKFCFNTALRGPPTRNLNWFLDKHKDATIKFQEQRYYKIKQGIFKSLRNIEIKLRLISRMMVLHDVIKRYRGIKDDDDSIDAILNVFKFKSLGAWCDWKDGFDRLVYEKYMETKMETHYCTGCGERSIRFTSKRGEEYEKCATDSCDYFHKVGSNFATVKKF